jgi:hypothetical protein
VEHVFEVIARHRGRVITDHIVPATTWRGGYGAAARLAEVPSQRRAAEPAAAVRGPAQPVGATMI